MTPSTVPPATRNDGRAPLRHSLRLLVQLQLAARLSTFVLNQLLVRLTSPAVFGAASIQLELLLGVVLSAARDGVRAATLRSERASSDSGSLDPAQQQTHNLSFLSVGAGLVLAPAAAWIYMTRLAPASLALSPYLAVSVGLYLFGGVLELLSEPLFNHAQAAGRVELRVRAEGASLVVNCVVVLVSIVRPRWMMIPIFDTADKYDYALVAYGLGRTAMGLTVLAVYVGAYIGSVGWGGLYAVALPKYAQLAGDKARLFSPSGLSLVAALSQQALCKYTLGELDKLAVARLGSLEDQGGYALASNYGSLVARILFFPVEEASRIQFARDLGGLSEVHEKDTKMDMVKNEVVQTSLDSSSSQLSEILRLLILLGAFFAAFGPSLAPWAIWLLAGPGWACSPASVAGFQLGVYALYVPVMGINGSSEGFLTATASPRVLRNYTFLLTLSSAAFIATLAGSHALESTALAHFASPDDRLAHARYESAALTLAAIAATLVRATACLAYIRWFFRTAAPPGKPSFVSRFSIGSLLPPLPALAALAASASILHVALPSSAYKTIGSPKPWTRLMGTTYPGASPPNACPHALYQIIPPIGLGAVLAVICLAIWYVSSAHSG